MRQLQPFFPEDGPGGYVPVKVEGDGNCCPRALSMLLFGNEDSHIELRCRLVSELAINEAKFLTPENWGINLLELKTIASLSNALADLSMDGIKKTFRQETLACSQNASFMGMWQLFAAAEVTGCPIRTVYPNLGWSTNRALHNRLIMPLDATSDRPHLHLMWSSDRDDQVKEHWVGNHLLPLLPVDVHNTAFVASNPPPPATRVGEFFKCLWHKREFVCEILDVDSEFVLLKFMMQPEGRMNLYRWPQPKDTSWEPINCLQERVRLELHASSTNRVQYYTVVPC